MHISEGILTGPSMAITLGLGAVAVAYGVHATNNFVATKPQRKPLLAMAGAFVFLVSLVPLPSYAGTCSHPCGTPLAAILLGPGVTILLSCLALFLQAAFFAHGGFSSLGANTLTLGVVGGCTGWATYHLARRAGLSRLWAGALAGLIGDVLTYVAAGFTLAAHL
ncbi:MAG TPA: energy-coupling factor ABC transporter permease, partial [bacterium]|nr:energy-coupling factor ABC transporter permease [bacterium]